MMKYNYPIKYAVMPIYGQVSFGLDKSIQIVGYIVSKCYIICDKLRYFEDGSRKREYEVVFPYQKKDITRRDDWQRVYPEFTYNNQCKNATEVSEVFDSFEDASNLKDKLNKDILAHSFGFIDYNSNYQNNIKKLKRIHNEKMDNFKQLEKKIQEETIDMVIRDNTKIQSIIALFKERDRILPMSIYDFIAFYKGKAFYACTVSEEDYEKMIEQINKDGLLDERIPRTAIKGSYERKRYLLASDVENKIIRIANCDSDTVVGSYYINEDGVLCYSGEMHSFINDPVFSRKVHGVKVYTTETYEDIIANYKVKREIVDEDKANYVKLSKKKN